MDIQQTDDGQKGHFFIEAEGKEIAGMYYTWENTRLVIKHTEVDEAYGGRGLGKQLLDALVKYVRSHHVKVIAQCPFARSVFDKVPEYRDVLE